MNRSESASSINVTQRGAGHVSTWLGFLMFMILMLGAVQILFNLYATSVVTGAAHDAARTVAGYDNPCSATADAESQMRADLGEYGAKDTIAVEWSCTADLVSLRVVADHPTVLPKMLRGLTGLGHMDRTIRVRVERFQ